MACTESTAEDLQHQLALKQDELEDLARDREILQQKADVLEEQAKELEDALSDAMEERDEAQRHVRELEQERKQADDALEPLQRRIEFLEDIVAGNVLTTAGERLLALLERGLGPERWDESLHAYRLFRAMDDLRDALLDAYSGALVAQPETPPRPAPEPEPAAGATA